MRERRHRDGCGSFGEAQRILFGTASVVLFDFDADGRDDLFVSDAENLGLMRGARGPMEVLARTRDPTVLYAGGDGIITTDGASAIAIHRWSGEERADVAPLVPRFVADVDGDGASDLVGIAGGQAAVRSHGGVLRVLGEASEIAVSQRSIIGWSTATARIWEGTDAKRTFPIPKDTIAIAVSPELTVAATRSALYVLEPWVAPIAGPWKDIHPITIDGAAIVVADRGAPAIAVVRMGGP